MNVGLINSVLADSPKNLPEDGVDTLFCSIQCMKNPVKYIEYTCTSQDDELKVENGEFTTKITTLKSTGDYYSKESHDVAILIEFVTKINKEYNLNFNLNMDEIRGLLENHGSFFLLKKDVMNGKIIKHKIHLKPIELKSV